MMARVGVIPGEVKTTEWRRKAEDPLSRFGKPSVLSLSKEDLPAKDHEG
jgi:hypothetical protein